MPTDWITLIVPVAAGLIVGGAAIVAIYAIRGRGGNGLRSRRPGGVSKSTKSDRHRINPKTGAR